MRAQMLVQGVLLLSLIGSVACGGKAASPSGEPASQSPTTFSPNPPAAVVVPLNKLPPVADLKVPLRDSLDVLAGPLNAHAADGLRESLRLASAGFDGIAIDVLPIADGDESVVIFSLDSTKSQSTGDPLSNLSNLLRAVTSAPAIEEANITTLAASIRGKDSGAVFVLTLSLPVSLARQAVAGQANLTQPPYAKQVVYQIRRVTQP